MGEAVESVRSAAAELRKQHQALVQMPQEAVIAALAEVGRRWRDPAYPLRREAETWLEPFPFAMVQFSLDALLDSLTPEKLWELVHSENAEDARGFPVVGHFLAGNTPLLGWVSIIRTLLVRSVSLVKLPSNAASQWTFLFHRSLCEIAPGLAGCVHLAQWAGGTTEMDAALCAESDLVMASGSDAALEALKALCPAQTPFISYGHRVSFGLLLPDAELWNAALGFARDVLLYDQGGCLSPQTIFVLGDDSAAQTFASLLADALTVQSELLALPVRARCAAEAVSEARALAWMEEGSAVWEGAAQRWTVITRTGTTFAASPTFGVVSVQPLASLQDLPAALCPVADRLQGCAVAGTAREGYLPGVSYLCEPGMLQAPPLSWRQDGRDVLRVLLPPSGYRAEGSTTMRVSAGISKPISSVEEE